MWGKVPNDHALKYLVESKMVAKNRPFTVAIEFPYPRGQTPSWQLFETCEWAGRFIHVAEENGITIHKMDRNDIKKFVAGSTRAKDPQVRKALISMFGGDACISKGKCELCGGKGGKGRGKARIQCNKCKGSGCVEPGLLSTMSADAWAALAVAVTYRNLGPSKTAQLLQEERKAKRATKKEVDLAHMVVLDTEFRRLLAIDTHSLWTRELIEHSSRLKRTDSKIKKIKERYEINE